MRRMVDEQYLIEEPYIDGYAEVEEQGENILGYLEPGYSYNIYLNFISTDDLIGSYRFKFDIGLNTSYINFLETNETSDVYQEILNPSFFCYNTAK